MEIISIYTRNKDDSILDFYPNQFLPDEPYLRTFEAFIVWSMENKNSTGVVQLICSSYDQAVKLLGTDDLNCHLSLIIQYRQGNASYSLSVPFDRSCSSAYITKNESS